MISLLFMTENRQFDSFIIITMILIATHDSAIRWEGEIRMQVVAVDDQPMDALRRGDPSPLEQIYADDYTLVTGLGQVRSKADHIAELKSGRLRYASIDSIERQVRLY